MENNNYHQMTKKNVSELMKSMGMFVALMGTSKIKTECTLPMDAIQGLIESPEFNITETPEGCYLINGLMSDLIINVR